MDLNAKRNLVQNATDLLLEAQTHLLRAEECWNDIKMGRLEGNPTALAVTSELEAATSIKRAKILLDLLSK
jgi:hypothetical protein